MMEKKIHPFIIINVTEKNIYGVQCTSVKKDDSESYFSRRGIPYINLKFYNQEYVTHVRTDSFGKIDKNQVKVIVAEPNLTDFNRLTNILYDNGCEDNEWFNDLETKNHILKEREQFGEFWRIYTNND